MQLEGCKVDIEIVDKYFKGLGESLCHDFIEKSAFSGKVTPNLTVSATKSSIR
jgi:hypothetical protein